MNYTKAWVVQVALAMGCAVSLVPYPESRPSRLAAYVAVALVCGLAFAAGKLANRPLIGPLVSILAATVTAGLTVFSDAIDANPRLMGIVFTGLFFAYIPFARKTSEAAQPEA